MNIAIIPARGGSKRIPRKNIKLFGGKPMIAWSIETAIQSGVFDAVWVSTDDQEIADIATEYGAVVPFIRPSNLADDHTGTAAVVRHAIEFAVNQELQPAVVGCIYATAPLLQSQYLLQGMNQLQQNPAIDYVFSGCRFSFPIQRALYRSAEGTVQPVNSDAIAMRSQDLPETFHDAGQFYLGRCHSWLNDKAIFSASSILLELPQHLVQDIDTISDWQRAELLHQLLLQKS